MRDLTATTNIAEIRDGISGDIHEIEYRTPTPDELAAYAAGLIKRKGRKLVSNPVENRLKFGLQIITGFKKGSIGAGGKAISCDPQDPDYREDWKSLLAQNAPDIVCVLAVSAFESTGIERRADLDVPLDE